MRFRARMEWNLWEAKKVKYKCERDEKKVIDIESHLASI